MKINWKKVAINVLTLGYTGTRSTSATIREIQKTRQVALSGELLTFMLIVPIVGGLTVGRIIVFELSHIIAGDGSPQQVITSTLPYFVYCFSAFTFIHILLASSLLQHTRNLSHTNRIFVACFGGYGLEWAPNEYIEADAASQADLETEEK
jgi:hypothetical protein